MSHGKDLDEYTVNELATELDRRITLVKQGLCPYCLTSLMIHTCKFSLNFPAYFPNGYETGAPPRSVLQDWVQRLGLRHQGVLLTAVRGCDVSVKDDPSKRFVRAYRGIILNAHVGDAKRSASFIEYADPGEVWNRFLDLKKQKWDHLPFHYVQHLIGASEIVGYKHPSGEVSQCWLNVYRGFCKQVHVNPETEKELDNRLNADEETFKRMQA